MNIQNIGVVGTGMIGSSLTAMFAGNRLSVVLVGRRSEGLSDARNEIIRIYDTFISRGIMTAAHKETALSLITFSADYSALKDADFIMEAVFEDADIKGEVFRKLERICKADAIIGSATSAISADLLSQFFEHKERFLVTHPWNPPHMVPLVEIVKSQSTSDETAECIREFFIRIHKKPVVLQKNIEGFVGNRLQHAMFREALYLIEQGIVSAEEVNDVVLYGFGQRYSSMKLFEHFDCAGLLLNRQVHENLYPTLCSAQKPQEILLRKIEEGKLGMKTGEGILDWHEKDMEDFRRRQIEPYYRFVEWDLGK